MSFLDVLSNAFETVEIPRGSVTILLDCYLEKISAHNDEYEPLAREGRRLKMEGSLLEGKMYLYTNAQWIQNELLAPMTAKEGNEGELPTEAVATARTRRITKEAKSLEEEYKANTAAQLANKAARIAYLTAAWRFARKNEKGETETVLPTAPAVGDAPGEELKPTAENILQAFSPPLLNSILEAIEGAVFGPLETQRPTGG